MEDLDPRFLVDILRANIDNPKLSEEQFRVFVRNSLPLYKGSTKDTDESTG